MRKKQITRLMALLLALLLGVGLLPTTAMAEALPDTDMAASTESAGNPAETTDAEEVADAEEPVKVPAEVPVEDAPSEDGNPLPRSEVQPVQAEADGTAGDSAQEAEMSCEDGAAPGNDTGERIDAPAGDALPEEEKTSLKAETGSQPVQSQPDDVASGTDLAADLGMPPYDEALTCVRLYDRPLLRATPNDAITVYLQMRAGGFVYTCTQTGSAMAIHWTNSTDSGYVEHLWCVQPSRSAVSNTSYALTDSGTVQTVKDVLQYAWEQGYWGSWDSDGTVTHKDGVAGTQLAVWRAVEGRSYTCQSASANAIADTIMANYTPGGGTGSMKRYRCTTNSGYQEMVWYEPSLTPVVEYGNAKIRKVSANPTITDNNPCYTLAGAVYGVYSSRRKAESDTDRLGTLTTDASGESDTLYGLEAGFDVFIRELTAPKGYGLDTNVYSLRIEANQTNVLTVSDTPQSDPVGVLLRKLDATTADGGATSKRIH